MWGDCKLSWRKCSRVRTGASRCLLLPDATKLASGETEQDLTPVTRNRESRTRRVTHDALGRAADEDVLEAGESVRGNDDQIRIQLARGFDDFIVGAAKLDAEILRQKRIHVVLRDAGQ